MKEQGQQNLRNKADFVIPHVKSASYGIESIRALWPKIGKSLPCDIKN